MRVYLAVTPDHLEEALRCTARVAHVAYRIDETGMLACSDLPVKVRGGIMVLSDGTGCAVQDISALCSAVCRECEVRGFGAVTADFEQPMNEELCVFLRLLSAALRKTGRRLYVPECYGCEVPQAAVLICTAVSGGSLRTRLQEARRTFGERIALDLQRLRMEFPLPCPCGEGRAVPREELEHLLAEETNIFFSEDLCARYFVRFSGCEPSLVLFDDADTLRRKLRIAQELGITAAFVMYPEVEDIRHELWRKN